MRRACCSRRVSQALTHHIMATPPAARSKRSWRRTRETTRSPSGFGALRGALRRAPSPLTPQRARRYLAWTQTHYPVGGPESQLTATLYKCGHELLPLERYKNDVRYLRVWVQYVRPAATSASSQRSHAVNLPQADCLEEPKQVFDFLEVRRPRSRHADAPWRAHAPRPRRAQHHKIGQEYALFYEARAAFLELRRNFDLALGVYEAGITRCVSRLPAAWRAGLSFAWPPQECAAAAAAEDQV